MQTDTSDWLIQMRTLQRISLIMFVFSRQMKESVAKVSIQMLFSGSIKFRATTLRGAIGVENSNMNEASLRLQNYHNQGRGLIFLWWIGGGGYFCA